MKTPRRNLEAAFRAVAKGAAAGAVANVKKRPKKPNNAVIIPVGSKNDWTVTKTKTKKKKKREKSVRTHGVYVGRFPVLKSGKTAFDVHAKRGIVQTQEVTGELKTGNTATTNETIIFAAHNVATQLFAQLACMGLARRLIFQTLNIDGVDPNIVLPQFPDTARRFFMTSADIISGSEATPLIYDFGVTVAANTLQDFGNAIYEAAIALDYNLNNWIRCGFRSVTNSPVEAEYNMVNCKLQLLATTHIKLQNSTDGGGAAGEEETSIQACPLQGKKYYVNQAYTRLKGHGFQLPGVFPTKEHGVIGGHGTVSRFFMEPPLPNSLLGVSLSRTVRLDPGEIKEDSLTYRQGMTFNRFFRELKPNGGAVANYFNAKFARTMLYVWEHVIKGQDTQGIRMFYEVNRRYGCSATIPKMVQNLERSVTSYINFNL